MINKDEEDSKEKGKSEEEENEFIDEKELIYFKRCQNSKQLEEKLYQMYKEYLDDKGSHQRNNEKDNACKKWNKNIAKIGINYPVANLKNKIINLNKDENKLGNKFRERYARERKIEGNEDNQNQPPPPPQRPLHTQMRMQNQQQFQLSYQYSPFLQKSMPIMQIPFQNRPNYQMNTNKIISQYQPQPPPPPPPQIQEQANSYNIISQNQPPQPQMNFSRNHSEPRHPVPPPPPLPQTNTKKSLSRSPSTYQFKQPSIQMSADEIISSITNKNKNASKINLPPLRMNYQQSLPPLQVHSNKIDSQNDEQEELQPNYSDNDEEQFHTTNSIPITKSSADDSICQLPTIKIDNNIIKQDKLYEKIKKIYEIIGKSYESYNKDNDNDDTQSGPFVFNKKLLRFQIEAEKKFNLMLYLFHEYLNIKSNCPRIILKHNELSLNNHETNDKKEKEIEKFCIKSYISDIRKLKLNERLSLFYQGKFNEKTHYSYEMNGIGASAIISYCSKMNSNNIICENVYTRFDEELKSYTLNLRSISILTGFFDSIEKIHFHHDEENNINKLYLCGDVRVKEFTIEGLDNINDVTKLNEIRIKNTNTFYFGRYKYESPVITIWDNELILGCGRQIYIWNIENISMTNEEKGMVIISKEELPDQNRLDFEKIDWTHGINHKDISIQFPVNFERISSFAVLKDSSYNETHLAVSFIGNPVIYVYNKNYENVSRLISHTKDVTCMENLNYALFSGSKDFTSMMWNINKGAPEFIFETKNQPINCIEISKIGDKIIMFTGCENNRVHCISITDKKPLFEMIFQSNFVPCEIGFISNKDEEDTCYCKLIILLKDTKFRPYGDNHNEYKIHYFDL